MFHQSHILCPGGVKVIPGTRVALFKAAGIVAALSIISKVFGFVRETSLAAGFGATHATDAYLVGQTIPMLLFAAVGGALATTFIPVFAEVYQKEGREAAYRMACTVINVNVIVAVAVIAAGELLAGPLTRLVAPGFQGEVFLLTVRLTRYLFPMILFQGLSGLFTGMLQTGGNFTVPAAVVLLFNAIIIFSIVVLGPIFGISAVALGTSAAVVAQSMAQLPALWRLGFRWRLLIDWKDPRLARIGALVVPVLLGSAAGQLGLLVDRMLASRLAEGSISALNYGNKLMALPYGVFGTAIATVLYPTLSQLAAVRDTGRFRLALSEGVRAVNFLLVPMSVGLMVLREPVVRLAFQRGAFDAAATEATSFALLFFSMGIVGFSLRDLVARGFYSFQDTATPMLVGVASVALNVALNLLLVGPLKHGGLALATSAASIFGVVAMLWLLRRRLGHLGGRAMVGSLWRVLLASGVMALAVEGARRWAEAAWPGTGVAVQAARLLAEVGVGALVYGTCALALGVPEMRLLLDFGGRAVRRLAPRAW